MVQYVIDYVYANGGIDYSRGVMQQYIDEAEAILNTFEDSPARASFTELMHYSVTRSK